MAVANTLTQPGGYVPDGQTSAADPGAGTLGSASAAGSQVHRAAPHKEPAKK